MQQQAPLKRACMQLNDITEACFVGNEISMSSIGTRILSLPLECLEQILLNCDTQALIALNLTCKAMRAFDPCTGLRLVEKIARAAVLAAAGEHAGRWRRRSWLAQLNIEDSAVGFANFAWSSSAPPQPDAAPHYRFLRPSSQDSFLHIKLEGMGPKLLVSDLSTADQPLLRWRLVVRGNTAVEFGVVPLCLVDDDKALHKCQQEARKFERLNGQLLDEQRPTGFCSSITVGSLLPFKTAIMKGSVVELLARRGRLEILVQNPPDGQELYWHNTRTVPKPYKGPREVRFEQDFSPDHDVKLALTSWAHGAFDVLHPAPGSRVLGPEFHQDWDRLTHRRSSTDSSTDSPGEDAQESSTAQQPPQQPWQQQDKQQEQQQQPQQLPRSTAAAAAAVAAAAAFPPQQPYQQHIPGSPASDTSTSSQEAMIS